MHRCWKFWALGVLAVTISCGSVSDTGFVGTWSRPMGRIESKISIAREGEGYSFCWSRKALQGIGGRHECSGPNRTDVYAGPDLVYTFDFKVTEVDESDELLVEVQGQPRDKRSTPIQYVDRLTLEPGGLALSSLQIELNHVKTVRLPTPVRFTKISDRAL